MTPMAKSIAETGIYYLYAVSIKRSVVMDEKLDELCKKYPLYIPVDALAEFLHVKPAGLRASIDQGRCDFGFGWKLGSRSAYKIPTRTFVAWYTKGVSLPS